MFRRLLVAIAFASAVVTPVQVRAQEPAQMEAMLAAMGGWMQDYLAVMTAAAAPFLDMSEYSTALDRFADGEASAAQARAGIESWEGSATEAIRSARAGAAAMRDPPSFAGLGPDGARLDTILNTARDSIAPTLDEMERVVQATAELGLAALDDRAKGFEARQRAFYQASIALTRVDRARIDLAATTLSDHHPTRHLAIATQHYYTTLDVMPRYLLAEFDGTEDRRTLVASLRGSAVGMRAALSTANARLPALRFEASQLQVGNTDGARIGRVMERMIETFPPSIAAYEGLASGIERAAQAIEAGADVNEVWTGLEASDRPHLDEIDRLDRLRANLLTDISRERL